MYRNEEKRELANKWSSWGDFLQFSSIFGLLGIVLILGALPKETAKVAVVYLAPFLFIYATIAFWVATKAAKHRMVYLKAERTRVSSLLDKAIKQLKKED